MMPRSKRPGVLCPAILLMAALLACERRSPSPEPPSAAISAQPKGQETARTHDSRMASELERAADRANICSAREAKAAGLRAEYFSSSNLTGTPMLSRQEGPLDLDWPQPGKEVAKPVASARWQGWVRPPFTGRFSFHTEFADARITVSGSVLTAAQPSVEMNAGRYHPISIELSSLPAPSPGAAPLPALKLSWTTPFGARYLMPRAVLYPPSDSVATVTGDQADKRGKIP